MKTLFLQYWEVESYNCKLQLNIIKLYLVISFHKSLLLISFGRKFRFEIWPRNPSTCNVGNFLQSYERKHKTQDCVSKVLVWEEFRKLLEISQVHRNICTVIHACRKISNFSSHSWIYFSESHESWEKAQLFKHADLVEFREAWGDVETYFLGNAGSDRDRVLRISGSPGILFAGPVCANCGSRIFPCSKKASDRAWRRYAQ